MPTFAIRLLTPAWETLDDSLGEPWRRTSACRNRFFLREEGAFKLPRTEESRRAMEFTSQRAGHAAGWANGSVYSSPGIILIPVMRRLIHDETFRRLCRARDLLASRYHLPVRLDQAAREACLSAFHFHRLYAAAFGETPHDFLTRLRIDRARQLLLSGNMSVTDICFEVGYSSLGSFSHKFRSLVGRSPSAYQREARRTFGFFSPWHILFVPDCYRFAFGGEDLH
jgi:AraC-like DNA-binding protein